ncbi:aminoglycoside adenylyltransferase domain-containing protein [Saccharopolyspora sp. NPDC002686]|uniref:nucleotidyltransferase domain-containing protein n=1 Tax=Saccharopolyspora sp. NPDC002686 TaxID=3154541 RepID=UPI00331749B7
MTVHPRVAEVVADYLDLVDAEAGGLVTGLYLEGSVAIGDFRPHASDVDFVAVGEDPPDAVALAALERVHARLGERRPGLHFDGAYLTWQDLAGGPDAAVGRPSIEEGRFRATSDRLSPVTWHTLARYGVVCRGPAVADLDIWADDEVLAAWQDANLDEYWGRLLARTAGLVDSPGPFSRTDDATAWTVTGVPRLHYTLTTGDITSKDGAGRHALRVFPERWHRVVREGLRILRAEDDQSLYGDPGERWQDVLAFGEMVIADAHRCYAERHRS